MNTLTRLCQYERELEEEIANLQQKLQEVRDRKAKVTKWANKQKNSRPKFGRNVMK